MFTLMGYYQLPNDAQPQLVNFAELFDTNFMRKYTRYRSFEKFLNGSGFSITCQKDFEDLPEEKMDTFVKKSTKFSSWQEMLDTATDKHIIKHRFDKQTSCPAVSDH